MEETDKLTHYYRWQFLRFNREYQIESDLCIKIVAAAQKNRRWSERKKQETILKLENKLYVKYGINGIYDYRRKRPPAELRIYGGYDFAVQKGTLKKIFKNNIADNQEIRGNHLFETVRRRREIKPRGKKPLKGDVSAITPKYVQVVINYDAELGDIEKEIKKIVKDVQSFRQKDLKIKRGKTRSKEISKLYDDYLEVWRLAEKGTRNKDIASQIFSQYENREAEDKANKYFKSAKALINGGYKKIAF